MTSHLPLRLYPRSLLEHGPCRTLEEAIADTGRTILFDEHLFAEERDCTGCGRPKWPSLTPLCLHCRMKEPA